MRGVTYLLGDPGGVPVRTILGLQRHQAAVDDANRAVSQAESIRKFHILTEEWTEEGGQLTPSLKLRRNVVLREFKDDVAALYAG